MITAILVALAFATLALTQRNINRALIAQRIARATTPITIDRAPFLRVSTRTYIGEDDPLQAIYPGAWGDMAQTIADDINMGFNN